MRLRRVSNLNKLVAEKINYFFDRLDHTVEYIGWQENLELESPTSLIEKILFRLTNDPEYRLEYFDNYFRQSFFTEDTFWEHYPSYPSVKKIVTKYNLLNKTQQKEKRSLLDSSEFQTKLKDLHKHLLHKLPEDLINAAFKVITCSRSLSEEVPGTPQTHFLYLNTIALGVVSEYFHRGYDKSEIKEIINCVISNDAEKFPFPANIRTKPQKRKYLKERTLEDQLKGFVNSFKKKQAKNIALVKVYGAQFPDEFSFWYDKVKFWGVNHPVILKVKAAMRKDDIESFFTNGQYVLATTSVEWYSSKSFLKQAQERIQKELEYLSAILNRNFSVDTTSNYLLLDAKMQYSGMGWSSQQFDNAFEKDAINRLYDNAFHVLRKINGEATRWFLQCEPLFVNAHKNNSVSDYWLYLETLLSINKKTKIVKEATSSIILSNEAFMRDRRVLNSLYYSLNVFSGGCDLLSVSYEQLTTITKALGKGRIAREIRKANYPFISELLNEFDEELSLAYFQKAKNYYYKILLEAYEFRNFFIHSGTVCNAAKIKLSLTLPIIVVRLRWAILDALKKEDANLPFDLLIDKLMIIGNRLTKK